MGLFRKKPQPVVSLHPVVVSIEPHETARKEAFEEAKKVNQHLNNLLVQNGFTLKLWVATGGNLSTDKANPTKKETKK
jgi:hypothetical protein